MEYSSQYDTEAFLAFPFIAITASSIAYIVLESKGIANNLAVFLSILIAISVMMIMVWDIRKLTICGEKVRFDRLFATVEFDISEIDEILDYYASTLYARRLLIIKMKNGKKLQVKETRDKAFQEIKQILENLDMTLEIKQIRK